MISFWRPELKVHYSNKSAANIICFQCIPVVISIPLLFNLFFGYCLSEKIDFVGLFEV